MWTGVIVPPGQVWVLCQSASLGPDGSLGRSSRAAEQHCKKKKKKKEETQVSGSSEGNLTRGQQPWEAVTITQDPSQPSQEELIAYLSLLQVLRGNKVFTGGAQRTSISLFMTSDALSCSHTIKPASLLRRPFPPCPTRNWRCHSHQRRAPLLKSHRFN